MADTRIDELRRRLDRDPGSRLFAQLAEEYRKAGNHADAIRVARRGLEQHPSYPSARLTLGRALLDSGDASGARVELETALRDAPDNILASRFLGQALERLGELGPALEQLRRTLKMAPGDRQLETQIASLEARLNPAPAGQPAAPPRPLAPPSSGGPAPPPMSWDVTAPVPQSRPAEPAAEAEPLPPTIRIRPAGEFGGGRRAPSPPPLPATAAPTAAAPSGPPPVATPPRAMPRLAVTERMTPASSAIYESDVAPTLPTAQTPPVDSIDETTSPTLPPGALAAEETVFEPEPPPEPAPPPASPLFTRPREQAAPHAYTEPEPGEQTSPIEPPPAAEEAPAPAGATPFSSSTLAELYLKQGLVERAVEVYRQLLGEEPGNERARARLAEIERTASQDGRATRRRQLERTIAGLEALLAVVQRTGP